AFALLHPLDLHPVNLGEAVHRAGFADSVSQFSMTEIFWHNFRVLVISAILSIFSFGVIGLVLVLSAFLLLGFLAGEAAQIGITPALFFGAFVAPHGLIEIPTVVLAGALNLRIGLALMAPPPGCTFGDSLMLALVNWLKTAALLIPLLALAAWV